MFIFLICTVPVLLLSLCRGKFKESICICEKNIYISDTSKILQFCILALCDCQQKDQKSFLGNVFVPASLNR